jgi:hypothetical protein
MQTFTIQLVRYATICLAIPIFFSCQSHEQKQDDAFEHVKEQKKVNKDSGAAAMVIQPEQDKPSVLKKNEKTDEWISFQKELEGKIVQNELNIKILKGAKGTSTKSFRKLAHLEKDNSDLRKQMNNFNADAIARKQAFKASIYTDVNVIGAELRDMTITGKK